MIFLDTSAVYAWTDSRDPGHQAAVRRLREILNRGEQLLTHNYGLLESVSLLQARLALSAAEKFAKDSAAFMIEWVDKDLHAAATRETERSGKPRVSLVDDVSCRVMKRRNATTALAF